MDLVDREAERVRATYAERYRRRDEARDSPLQLGNLLLLHERTRVFVAGLGRYGAAPLAGKEILEIGCGSGAWLRDLVHLGADPERLTGVDLLPASLARARRVLPSAVRLQVADAARLPLPDASFDLALQSTVFSSILDRDVRRRVAAELLRVVKPRGFIVWYDARVGSPRNPHFVAMPCRELRALFPDCRIDARAVTLLPPLLRALAPHSAAACRVLATLPWLRTHYLAFIQRRETRPSG